MKLIAIPGLFFLLNTSALGQDTLHLEKKPDVILKSWYPEFKEFPILNVGEAKILFAKIPDFEKMSIRNNDINLVVKDNLAKVEETEKKNQYLFTVVHTDSSYLEVEVWFHIGNFTIFIKENSKWVNISSVYPLKENRIMLQKVKLKVER